MVLARFLPRDERFFDYFRQATENAAEVAQALCDLLENYSDIERKALRIRDLERKGDDITHQIFKALNSTFVTPLDREDIADLATRLDDFVDAIEEAARRIRLYSIDQSNEYARRMAHIIDQQAALIASTVPLLESRRQWDKMLQCSIDINRLEGEADEVLDQALPRQFDGVSDIGGLIKAMRWGEIYQYLEDAADRGEDIADTLERIVVKNA
jgi:predicted phosphate transport protein (TIGR00153 family)